MCPPPVCDLCSIRQRFLAVEKQALSSFPLCDPSARSWGVDTGVGEREAGI